MEESKLNRFIPFLNFFQSGQQQSWIFFVKAGSLAISLGLLILMLKEVIIAFIAAICIVIGIYLLVVAFRLWYSSRMNRL